MKEIKKQKKPRGKGRPFPKGVSGNPKGKPKLTEVEREVRHALRHKIADVAKLLTIPKDEVDQVLKDKDSTLLHEIFGKSMKQSDYDTIEKYFINRMIGKTKEVVHQVNKNLEVSVPKDKAKDILKTALDELE